MAYVEHCASAVSLRTVMGDVGRGLGRGITIMGLLGSECWLSSIQDLFFERSVSSNAKLRTGWEVLD